MIKLKLNKPKAFSTKQFHAYGVYPWSTCAPFVENSRGLLIHRPKTVSTYSGNRKNPHIGIGYWCGNHVSGDKNFTFLDTISSDGKLVCLRCEENAVAAGLPSSDELVGKHVHKGGLIAVKKCCEGI